MPSPDLSPTAGAPDDATHAAPSGSVVADLRSLLQGRDFRRLFTVRLVSQLGDGMFQVGLATLFFFSATTSPAGVSVGRVAAAFAVMLLPFTIVGPWAGPLLDRWRRRQVLLVGNLVRGAIAVALAVLMATVGESVAVYVLALLALSINRFLLSALSASLPRVVEADRLLTANALVPTLGSVAAGIGGAVGFVTSRLFTSGSARDAAALVLAGVAFTTAAVLALRLRRDQLGPEAHRSTSLREDLGRVGRDLLDGARYLLARRTPAQGLAVIVATRFLYGLVFISGILMCRNLFSDPTDADAGLARFGTVLAASGVGFALAVVLTPTLSRRTGPHRWITACLVLGVVAQLVIVVDASFVAVVVAAVLLGLAAQGAKIAVDTIVQRDTDDAYRGRAFALYDVLYNAGFVGAAALAAVVLPDTGYSVGVYAALAVAYALLAWWYGRHAAREPRPVPLVTR